MIHSPVCFFVGGGDTHVDPSHAVSGFGLNMDVSVASGLPRVGIMLLRSGLGPRFPGKVAYVFLDIVMSRHSECIGAVVGMEHPLVFVGR